MPYIKFTNPDGTSVSVGIGAEDIASLFKWFSRKRDPYLNYDLAHVAGHYGDLEWIDAAVGRRHLRVPYTLLHDYRRHPTTDWGVAEVKGTYRFPAQLEAHRKAMNEQFTKEGRLYKGDSLCPRVAAFALSSAASPVFRIERAWYSEQVGSNLTLDYPLPEPLRIGRIDCKTVREWDRAQALGDSLGLAEFAQSRLANTIGVSIGITCRTRDGRLALLRRRRAKNVAVYAGMWASPFAFAVSIPRNLADGRYSLRDIIGFDLGVEFADELGLELSDFTPPTPVAFCRDVVRGGKPEIFFEMFTDIAFETIAERLGRKSAEYKSRVRLVDETPDPTDISIAPELACFVALKALEVP